MDRLDDLFVQLRMLKRHKYQPEPWIFRDVLFGWTKWRIFKIWWNHQIMTSVKIGFSSNLQWNFEFCSCVCNVHTAGDIAWWRAQLSGSFSNSFQKGSQPWCVSKSVQNRSGNQNFRHSVMKSISTDLSKKALTPAKQRISKTAWPSHHVPSQHITEDPICHNLAARAHADRFEAVKATKLMEEILEKGYQPSGRCLVKTHELSWNTYRHSGSTCNICNICSFFDLFMQATLLLCAQFLIFYKKRVRRRPPIGSNPTVTLPLRILQCDPRSFAFEPWWWNHGDAKENALRRRRFLMNKTWPLRNCWFSGVTYQDIQ